MRGASLASQISRWRPLAIVSKIRQRQIYWLSDCEPLDGDADKDRPVIVLSSPKLLQAREFPLVVACTTHPRKNDQPRFLVPSREKEPETGLPKDCWALPRWYMPINPFRLTALKGTCPMELFNAIFAAVMAQIETDANKHGVP